MEDAPGLRQRYYPLVVFGLVSGTYFYRIQAGRIKNRPEQIPLQPQPPERRELTRSMRVHPGGKPDGARAGLPEPEANEARERLLFVCRTISAALIPRPFGEGLPKMQRFPVFLPVLDQTRRV